ncbi:EamA family transporter [Flavivirga algicola]|uniref:EamA family transporter n=1 Tax=Flavivirga algicola TaxID=2729136 RepID=A0ABX1RX16_9FLAO|nr:EamA family transporter [Flavivirga algicola]NMH87313.1 EamA family transporter [Flavivirga algicola]
MATTPFLLVLISIFTHAYWNYLIKSSENKHVFTAFSKLAEIVIFAIPAMYFFSSTDFKIDFLWLILIASIITFLNYYFLSSAYKYGELSLVYPVSRSSIIFLPVLAYFIIGETINTTGVAAIILIILGTFIMHLDSFDKRGFLTVLKSISNKGSIYALLAALTVAGYTLWDKISITKMQPFLYFYSYTFLIACFYNSFIYFKFSKSNLVNEWTKNKTKIIQVGFFNSFTYILVLTALTMSKASYVGGLRQLSIVIGVFFGYKLLNEKLNKSKIIGVVISILGGSLIYIAK